MKIQKFNENNSKIDIYLHYMLKSFRAYVREHFKECDGFVDVYIEKWADINKTININTYKGDLEETEFMFIFNKIQSDKIKTSFDFVYDLTRYLGWDDENIILKGSQIDGKNVIAFFIHMAFDSMEFDNSGYLFQEYFNDFEDFIININYNNNLGMTKKEFDELKDYIKINKDVNKYNL